MDAFKNEEIIRMEKGGNKKCKAFFEKAPEFYDGMTISEQYSADFAEDYKEKVGCRELGAGRESSNMGTCS
jgi:ADP-ribosylation factor GTPase-activating protein 1